MIITKKNLTHIFFKERFEAIKNEAEGRVDLKNIEEDSEAGKKIDSEASLKKSDEAYNEIMIDYSSKYYERFVEGSSLSAYNTSKTELNNNCKKKFTINIII